jgi:hypothetical protein
MKTKWTRCSHNHSSSGLPVVAIPNTAAAMECGVWLLADAHEREQMSTAGNGTQNFVTGIFCFFEGKAAFAWP